MEFHLDKDRKEPDIGGKPSILGLMSWAIYRDLKGDVGIASWMICVSFIGDSDQLKRANGFFKNNHSQCPEWNDGPSIGGAWPTSRDR